MRSRAGASVMVLLLAFANVIWSQAVLGQEQNGQKQSGQEQSESGQEQNGQEKAFRSEVDLVSVYFTVRDGQKRLVTDLQQGQFSVSEEGQPQTINYPYQLR